MAAGAWPGGGRKIRVMSSAGCGLLSRKPCTASQSCASRNAQLLDRFDALGDDLEPQVYRPVARIALTMAASSGLMVMSLTKLRSILRLSIGKRLR